MESIEIKIPEDRIGVLIGKEGEVKKRIESVTGCKIEIDSKNGVVKIKRGDDAIGYLKARNVVDAISKGFNPEIALKLLDDDIIFETIKLDEYVSPKSMERVKGRIIGKGGKMRKLIEETLNVHVSIYDKYVSIIGGIEFVQSAREAIVMLIDGAQHSTVQKFMERKKREINLRSLDWRDLS